MRKFAIAKTSTVSPSTAKAVANSTPVIKAFCEEIMSHYTGEASEEVELTDAEAVQNLFNKWPNDAFTQRLAEFTKLLTGISPDLTKVGQGNLKIGQLYKYNGAIYVIAGVLNGYAYGINVKCNVYHNIPVTTNINAATYAVTRAEAGEFAKEFLKVDGTVLVGYVAQTLGAPVLSALLKQISPGIV